MCFLSFGTPPKGIVTKNVTKPQAFMTIRLVKRILPTIKGHYEKNSLTQKKSKSRQA
jgi:hypothetical protein